MPTKNINIDPGKPSGTEKCDLKCFKLSSKPASTLNWGLGSNFSRLHSQKNRRFLAQGHGFEQRWVIFSIRLAILLQRIQPVSRSRRRRQRLVRRQATAHLSAGTAELPDASTGDATATMAGPSAAAPSATRLLQVRRSITQEG